MVDETIAQELRHRDLQTPEPKKWCWGRDYGQDILADLNQMAHAKGTGALQRDLLQRAYAEILRLRRTSGEASPFG